MRLLIYGMQSSGASTLSFVLAQKPGCAAFIDVWALYAAPSLAGDGDVVAKVVVTTAFPLALHQERFRPDRTILFLRHPGANYRSLSTKAYRHHCGFLEEKFVLLDEVYNARSGIDAIFHYEDLVFDPLGTLKTMTGLGWNCDSAYLRFPRPNAEIMKVNQQRYPELRGRLEYGLGNHRANGLRSDFADLSNLRKAADPVVMLCPSVTRHYRSLMRGKNQQWRPRSGAAPARPLR